MAPAFNTRSRQKPVGADPFNKLPMETCEQIFIGLRSKRSMLNLTKASPCMLRNYIASKSYIDRAVITADLDVKMIQDVMLIVSLCSWDQSRTYRAFYRDCFDTWRAQGFTNPFETKKHSLINDVVRLYHRLMLFIEDYLSKATARFPPRNYLCLPSLLIGDKPTFKNHKVNVGFDSAHLLHLERQRLLQAFLRYEILCRAFHPPKGVNHFWKTKLLRECRGQKLHIPEREAIACVDTYVQGLYGAMFAQCSDARLPVIPNGWHTSRNSGLLYPDSVYFDAGAYALNMGLQSSERDALSASLATRGFGLATTLLRSATAGPHGRESLKRWFEGMYRSWRQMRLFDEILYEEFDNDSEYCGACKSGDTDNRGTQRGTLMHRCCKKSPGMYPVLRPLVSGKDLQQGIYQQRAWIFFDNNRFYPPSRLHFPTWDKLIKQSEEMNTDVDRLFRPDYVRALRRSQKRRGEQRGQVFHSQAANGSQIQLPVEPDEACFRELGRFWL